MPPKTERNQQIVAAYQAGVCLSELARQYGMSASNVYRIVRARMDRLPHGELVRRIAAARAA